MIDAIRKFDAYPKAIDEFRVKSISGAAVSILSVLLMLMLFFSELSFYYTPETDDYLYVNTTRFEKIKVNFDITFHSIPCKLLSLDVLDETGSPQKDALHEIFKHRVVEGKKQGTSQRHEAGDSVLSEKQVMDLHLQHQGSCDLNDDEKIDCGYMGINQEGCEAKGCCWQAGHEGIAWCYFKGLKAAEELKPDDCGNCYGAGRPGECCNTCDDVKAAYTHKGWRLKLHTVSQCQKEAFRETMLDQFSDSGGCQLYGELDLNQASGHFHIAPHKSLFQNNNFNLGNGLFNLLELISFTFDQFNITHTVNTLTFGDQFPGITSPLDGQTRSLEDSHGMYQYYLKIVPTQFKSINGNIIESNQYSVTEHLRHLAPGSGRGMPGVYFYYELSPIHAVFQQRRKGFWPFLTSLCAIVGGAYTVMGVVELTINRMAPILSHSKLLR